MPVGSVAMPSATVEECRVIRLANLQHEAGDPSADGYLAVLSPSRRNAGVLGKPHLGPSDGESRGSRGVPRGAGGVLRSEVGSEGCSKPVGPEG